MCITPLLIMLFNGPKVSAGIRPPIRWRMRLAQSIKARATHGKEQDTIPAAGYRLLTHDVDINYLNQKMTGKKKRSVK